MPQHRRVIVEQVGEETCVRFAESKILDKPNIEAIADELNELVERQGPCRMRIDFGNVDYLSSFALGKLVSLQRKLQNQGGSLVLCNVPSRIFRVFEVAKLDAVFDIRRGAGRIDAP